MSAEPITCRYANRPGWSAACGAFSREHHARAAEAGVCCVVLAFSDLGKDQGHDFAPTGPDWPDFAPTDDETPGGVA